MNIRENGARYARLRTLGYDQQTIDDLRGNGQAVVTMVGIVSLAIAAWGTYWALRVLPPAGGLQYEHWYYPPIITLVGSLVFFLTSRRK